MPGQQCRFRHVRVPYCFACLKERGMRGPMDLVSLSPHGPSVSSMKQSVGGGTGGLQTSNCFFDGRLGSRQCHLHTTHVMSPHGPRARRRPHGLVLWVRFSFCRSWEGTSQQLMTQLVQRQHMLQRQIQQQHQEPNAGRASCLTAPRHQHMCPRGLESG